MPFPPATCCSFLSASPACYSRRVPKNAGVPPLRAVLAGLWRGETVLRASMHEALRRCSVSGRVLDVGGARNPRYFSYIAVAPGAAIEAVDGKTHPVDFEADPLPYPEAVFDSAVCCNVLEHVFNHRHLAAEVARVLRPGGRLVGFVPFLIQYHPDPRDYFRYTHEALVRILAEAGFAEVEVLAVGAGPFGAHLNNVCLMLLPRLLRPILALVTWPVILLSVALRPSLLGRYPLGYVFRATRAAQ